VEVIKLHYDILVGGHKGRWKITELIGELRKCKEIGRRI